MKKQPKHLNWLGDSLDQVKSFSDEAKRSAGHQLGLIQSGIEAEDWKSMENKITKGSANVFEDLGFDVQEAQNLLLRSQTMIALVQWFEASGMTQTQAAKTLGITQPRFNQLLKGKIEIFSLDALVNMATSAGMRVGLRIRPVTSVKVRNTALQKTAQTSKRRVTA